MSVIVTHGLKKKKNTNDENENQYYKLIFNIINGKDWSI